MASCHDACALVRKGLESSRTRDSQGPNGLGGHFSKGTSAKEIAMAGEGSTLNGAAPSAEGQGLSDLCFRRLADVATGLAESLSRSGTFQLAAVTYHLAQIAREFTQADLAYVRQVHHGDLLELCPEAVKADDCPDCGDVPAMKHRDDCQCPINRVGGGPRDHRLDEVARTRLDSNGQQFYSREAIEHFEWLGSEAFVPLAVEGGIPAAIICLGHRSPSHFDNTRIQALRETWGLFQALYRLGDLSEDRAIKSLLLQNVAAVVPLFTEATSLQSFQRAIVTLLTCGHGFKFDRAILFWMENGELPARCEMAVGGVLGAGWSDRRLEIGNHFNELRGGLAGYVRDALDSPVPGTGSCQVPDTLYGKLCQNSDGLYFRQSDGGEIARMIQSGGRGIEPPVPNLSCKDDWIAKARRTFPDVFNVPNDEYFLFALRPLGDEEAPLLGFILADMASRAQKHSPGLGFPNLEMASVVLQMITGLWHFRERQNSYSRMLSVLPLLRHGGTALHSELESLTNHLGPAALAAPVCHHLESIGKVKDDLIHARSLADGLRSHQFRAQIDSFPEFLRLEAQQLSRTFQVPIACNVSAIEGISGVRGTGDMLHSILSCLIANAVTHGRMRDGDPLQIEIVPRIIPVSEAGLTTSHRLVLEVANNGRSIAEELANFLFVARVSTATENGHGTGLSSARVLAQAFGGDVILLSRDPVRFAVVVDLSEGASLLEARNAQNPIS